MTTTPGNPEYLDGPSDGPGGPGSPGGSAHAGDHDPGNDNRKRLIALGAIVVGGAVVAGGAWAATSFFATGSQPAEALPDSTIAYVSVDLDPSGGQKIEAIKMLKKFPAFTDQIDLETDDDLRERLFEEVLKSSACEGIEFGDDVEPWLGSRAAMAAVDLGEDEPTPIGVIQVSDADAAEAGVAKLVETCGAETGGDAGGWVVEGDWMVLAETEERAQQVVDAAAEGSLAADSSFGEWTGEAGDDGFMSMYVAKAAAQYLNDAAGMGAMLGGMPMEGDGASGGEVPAELQDMIDKFDGAAATVRFDDGAVEVEYAMSNYQEDMTKFIDSETGVDMAAGLPEDTIAAFGLSLEEGWAQALLDYFKKSAPSEADSIDEQLAQFESETGMAFPEDVETLLGEGVTISLGSGIDPDAITNGGPGEIPAGIRIKGDAGEIQAVLDKISELAGPEAAEFLQVTEGDGYAVVALQDDYRSTLESGGDLGGNDAYAKVVDSDDAQTVMYVNFDADDDWLVRLSDEMGAGAEVSENLAPLSAFGVTGWVDGDVVHGQLKLTTN